MGILEYLFPESGEQAIGEANSLVTEFGAVDALAKADSATALEPMGTGLPGSSALGHVGGALSTLGLVNDVVDIGQHGFTGDNTVSALGNSLGAGSYGLGLGAQSLAGGGAASAGAATVMGGAASVLAAGAGGVALGTESNKFISDTGLLGDGADGVGRDWSDMAGDWGVGAMDAVNDMGLGGAGGGALMGSVLGSALLPGVGTVLGAGLGALVGGDDIAQTAGILAGSTAGTAATIASAPLIVGHTLGKLAYHGVDAIAGDDEPDVVDAEPLSIPAPTPTWPTPEGGPGVPADPARAWPTPSNRRSAAPRAPARARPTPRNRWSPVPGDPAKGWGR